MKPAMLLIALLGCSSSEEREAFAKLAREANPILEQLRPIAQQVRLLASRTDASSRSELVALCSKLHPELQALDSVRDLFFAAAERAHGADVPLQVTFLLGQPMGLCREAGDPELCTKNCAEAWNALGVAVDRIGELAVKHDVKLTRLR